MSTKTTKTQLKAPIDDHASALTRIIVMTRERDELLAELRSDIRALESKRLDKRDEVLMDSKDRESLKRKRALLAEAEARAQ